jgi:hypothetical protein
MVLCGGRNAVGGKAGAAWLRHQPDENRWNLLCCAVLTVHSPPSGGMLLSSP